MAAFTQQDDEEKRDDVEYIRRLGTLPCERHSTIIMKNTISAKTPGSGWVEESQVDSSVYSLLTTVMVIGNYKSVHKTGYCTCASENAVDRVRNNDEWWRHNWIENHLTKKKTESHLKFELSNCNLVVNQLGSGL